MNQSNLLRVDLHTHSWYSADSPMSPARLVRSARKAGLDRVAITDHGAVAGALEAYALDPELVIVGEEVKCANGAHMIGLFLHQRIPNKLPVKETAQRIRDQGGVVYAPHPYAYVLDAVRRTEAVLEVADVVEVFNARAFVPSWNPRAAAAAAARRLPTFAGTDGHFPWEIGRANTRLPAFHDAASFLVSARATALHTPETTHTYVLAASLACELLRMAIGSRHGSRPPFVGRRQVASAAGVVETRSG
jgi:predicted metal-dependent phosphoesterase TrpH